MKKIMILGGSEKSTELILCAKARGYYIVLCDYDKEIENIKYADKFYCVSVFDEDKLYSIGIKEKVDGVVSFSSDKIALIAANLQNRLGCPSNPSASIEILIKKDLFRKFLKEHGYLVPDFFIAEEWNEDFKDKISKIAFPLMVKPVDSAGSTGVAKIFNVNELEKAFLFAKENSPTGKVIVEQYIQMNHECMIAGDAFVYNGKVEFYGLLNSHRAIKKHPFIPTGTSYPSFLNYKKEKEVKNLVQNIITDLGIKYCPLNLELMYDSSDRLYVIEIAPRNGGNMIPTFINQVTGVDLIDALVATSVGDIPDFSGECRYNYATTYVIRSLKDGILDSIHYSDKIKNKIFGEFYYIKKGEAVHEFDRANKAIGIIFLKFDNLKEEKEIISNMENYIEIKIN